jgi:N utilization substance protein B
MSKRREGREAAIQFLFQTDLNSTPAADLAALFWKMRAEEKASAPSERVRAFAGELIDGVSTHRAEIDERIKACLVNFELDRLAAVDRNVLRVAIYELLYSPEVAPVIIINEAIEIAKKFGTEKSGGFINGVLDRVKNEIGRPARVGVGKEEGKRKKEEVAANDAPRTLDPPAASAASGI